VRGVACAIGRASSTAPGSSIIGISRSCARPSGASISSSQAARSRSAAGCRVLGRNTPAAPARQAASTSGRNRAASALTRTNTCALLRATAGTASASAARAASFSGGATPSSRSRMIASAPRSCALATKRGAAAGT
jgi:hypothetical protein